MTAGGPVTDQAGPGPAEVAATAAELQATFGVPVWFGRHTGKWWAMLPIGGEWGRFIEAESVDRLASALRDWLPARVAPRTHRGIRQP